MKNFSLGRPLSLALLLSVLACPALAAPEFSRYYGKDAVQEGQGGEMKVVEGIEFWSNGAPPRRFEVIGYLSDRRHATGLIGAMRLKGLEKAIAKAARENGGDAVILVGAEREVVGFASSANANANSTGPNSASAWGSSATVPVAKQNTRYAVIRFLPDLPAETEEDSPAEGAAEPAEAASD
ncbi:hypothetical protein [Arenimonas caeni]|uniref:hypothetical protein n=1 Tax=Arenimonas caeni TaxID=2058085 RepID=UPI0013B05263|nr:hypothetical protein [Arenimonas caeni]